MSLKRKTHLTLSKDSHAHQAFRSPFRSPRPSDNSVESKNFSTIGQASASRGLEAGRRDSPRYREEVMADQMKEVTPSKPLTFSSQTTPQNVSGRHHVFPRKFMPGQLKSPFQSPRNKLFPCQPVAPEEQLDNLMKQEVDLDRDITALKKSGYKIEELQSHIDNLHRYNEVKDAAQLVLGRLAELEQVTLKEMHKKYKVPASE